MLPLSGIYKVFRIIFICFGIAVTLFAFLVVQVGDKIHSEGGFDRVMESLYKGIFQSWFWTAGFLVFSFMLFGSALILFEKRRSFVE